MQQNGIYRTGKKAIGKIIFAKKYKKWIMQHENIDAEQIRQDIEKFVYHPFFSICIPVYNVEEKWLRKCIQSVQNQYYTHWQLCMADDCSIDKKVKEILHEYEQEDNRICVVCRTKNGHISRATNSALQIAEGEFIVLMDNDDELAPNALYEVAKVLQENRDRDIIYSDEDKIDENGNRSNPYFKPEYCPDTLLSNNYISHLTVYRKSVVKRAGEFRTGVEGAQDYDLLLRTLELTDKIYHIPKVLYHWRAIQGSTALDGGEKDYAYEAGKKVLKDTIKRRKYNAKLTETKNSPCYNVEFYPTTKHLVSVIVQPQKNIKSVQRCLKSIFEKTKDCEFEILLIENFLNKKIIREISHQYKHKVNCRIIKAEKSETEAVQKNKASQYAKGDLLLFLSSEVEILTKKWLQRLIGEAEREKVGAVGVKILGVDNRIQQAGMYLSQKNIYKEVGTGRRKEDSGYMYYLSMRRNYSAVSANCLMVKKQLFEQVGGFDKNLQEYFYDVDLCLRLQCKGYYNIYLPDVEIRDHCRCRYPKIKKNKEKRQAITYMKNKWGNQLLADPCDGRWFSLDSIKL